MEADRIQYLVSGYINNTLTAAETDELVGYSFMDDGKEVIANVISDYLGQMKPQAGFDKEPYQYIWKNVVGVDTGALRAEERGHKGAKTERGAKNSSQGSELEVSHGDTGAQRGTEINTGAEIPLVDQEEEGHEDTKTRRGTKDTSLREDIEGTEIPLLRKGLESTQGASLREGEREVVRIWRWVAAAVVIGVMGLGVWWMMSRNNTVDKPGVAVVPKVQDVAPGRQGAILTLSDGKQIVLDSAGNGALALQGKTSIVKQGGELRYEKSGAISSEEVVYNTMTTPKGRQYSLLLADGSKVWLNAASSIKFPTAFTGNTRVVEITGEAYFEVAHNAAKPFIVSVGDMQVEVLGTHFNINSYSDEPEIKTTLLEGKVRVTKGASIGILKPGQQAQMSGANELKITEADVDAVMAWKNGYFQFDNATLQQVMRQLERWYDVEVEYKGQVPPREFVGTMSRNTSLAGVLKILAANNIHFTIEGRKIVVEK